MDPDTISVGLYDLAMRSLELRIKDFLARPLPDEIALNHNPDSLVETVLLSFSSGQKFDSGLTNITKICISEVDQAIGAASSENGRAYLMESRKLLVEIMQSVL